MVILTHKNFRTAVENLDEQPCRDQLIMLSLPQEASKAISSKTHHGDSHLSLKKHSPCVAQRGILDLLRQAVDAGRHCLQAEANISVLYPPNPQGTHTAELVKDLLVCKAAPACIILRSRFTSTSQR